MLCQLFRQKPLTPRQRDLVEAVRQFTAAHAYAPSLSDLGRELGVSRQHAQRLALEAADRGHLIHDPGTARSWRLATDTNGRD